MCKNRLSEIVLIADRLYHSSQEMDISGNKLEMISDEYFEEVFNGLKPLGHKITHYESPMALIDNARIHVNSVVFTIYGGANSINRMALVPGVCESYNIKFAGADVYGRVICQDKFLSKQFAERFGIKTANSILVDKLSRIPMINQLKLPLVVKPNFEGSSIGISNSSLVQSHKEAQQLAKELITQYFQPIIVEEFIVGSEVSICMVGTSENIEIFEVVEIVNNDNPRYFWSNLYTAEDKHIETNNISHQVIKNALSEEEIAGLKNAFSAFPKMDYLRIDGRLNDSGFSFIEFTPDAYLGEFSTMNDAARENGLSYTELLDKIINSALTYYQTPYSSYK